MTTLPLPLMMSGQTCLCSARTCSRWRSFLCPHVLACASALLRIALELTRVFASMTLTLHTDTQMPVVALPLDVALHNFLIHMCVLALEYCRLRFALTRAFAFALAQAACSAFVLRAYAAARIFAVASARGRAAWRHHCSVCACTRSIRGTLAKAADDSHTRAKHGAHVHRVGNEHTRVLLCMRCTRIAIRLCSHIHHL